MVKQIVQQAGVEFLEVVRCGTGKGALLPLRGPALRHGLAGKLFYAVVLCWRSRSRGAVWRLGRQLLSQDMQRRAWLRPCLSGLSVAGMLSIAMCCAVARLGRICSICDGAACNSCCQGRTAPVQAA